MSNRFVILHLQFEILSIFTLINKVYPLKKISVFNLIDGLLFQNLVIVKISSPTVWTYSNLNKYLWEFQNYMIMYPNETTLLAKMLMFSIKWKLSIDKFNFMRKLPKW